jgi:DNA-directed RNA polymerase specialized sigma24 family protein
VLPLLEQIAERFLCRERGSITLEAEDPLQEADLRLADLAMPLNDHQHFVSLVSRAMRRVLVDHARRRHAIERGDRPLRITRQLSPTRSHIPPILPADRVQRMTDLAQ